MDALPTGLEAGASAYPFSVSLQLPLIPSYDSKDQKWLNGYHHLQNTILTI